jgi:hypothetical protein
MPSPIQVMLVRPQKFKRYTGALTEAKKQALNYALEELDKYGRAQVKQIQEEAPEKKGLFAQGFTYSVKKSGPHLGELRINWYPKDRPKNLLEWLTFGTGIHGPRRRPVIPKKVYQNEVRVKAGKKARKLTRREMALSWQDPNTGKWISRASVSGIKPNNFLWRAWYDVEIARMRGQLGQNVGKLIRELIIQKSNRA